jgi:hypothetical protein
MKKLFIIGGVLLVIIVAVVVIGLSKLGPIIKHAVNTYGPEITKTEVSVSDVGISIFAGQAKLKNFFLGNPKGFKSPQAMKVGSIYVDVNEKSLTSDTVIVETVEVVRPEITYEKKSRTDNFKTILNNVQSTASKSRTSKKKSAKEGEGKKLVITNFIVKQGKVNLDMSMIPGSNITASASLPDIHLKDVGKKKGGATPEEVFNEVFAVLYKSITSPDVMASLNKELEKLGSRVDITVDEGTKKQADTAAEAVKGLFGK